MYRDDGVYDLNVFCTVLVQEGRIAKEGVRWKWGRTKDETMGCPVLQNVTYGMPT